jgi:mannan endo-1,4-beta-mannosidase
MKIIRFGGQFAKLCFIAALSCLFALGPGSSARASSGFHVSGRLLLDANGNNFIMRGINIPLNWWRDETISSFPDVKATGANTVRVVLSDGQLGLWPKDSASDVANAINLCKANKLVCVLEVHDTIEHLTTLAQAAAYWIEIKSVLMGEEAYVIINIGNEPYGDLSAADSSLWINDTKNAIAELRAAGFEHMLMVDGPNWSQDQESIMRDNAASVFNSDPLRNTVFSVHMYEAFGPPGALDAPAKVQNYVSSFVNAGLPLVIGEFGPVNDGPGADVDAVMAGAQTNGIGYLGWEWSGDSDPALDMVTDFDPNQETSWGNRIIHGPNGIASTSQEASIYGGSATLDAVTTGVFRPSNGLLYLKNSNTTGIADAALNYGNPGDYPVVGDWDGNGTVTIGIYRNGSFYLRNSNTIGFADTVFSFGQPGDQPIAGDWDGNGVDTVGLFRNGIFFLRNSNSPGAPDASFGLGNPGDVGVAGDWNGDGLDTTGVFRPSNGIIFLKDSNNTGIADHALNYGLPGDKPVTGDWDGDGVDTIGVYRNGQFMLRNSNTNGFAEIIFGLGNPGDMPIAGNWDALP